MKREIVKELLNLSDDTLKKINIEGLAKHRDIAQHYANGGDVEFSMQGSTIYDKTDNPKFQKEAIYRKAIQEIEVLGVRVRANPPLSLNDELPNKIFILHVWAKHGYVISDTNNYYETLIKRGHVWANKEDIKAVVKALGWVSDER